MPLPETAALAPESPYATTKFAVERMLADFARAYGLRFVALRYFNAAGAAADGAHGEHHDPETHLMPILLQTLLGLRRARHRVRRRLPDARRHLRPRLRARRGSGRRARARARLDRERPGRLG